MGHIFLKLTRLSDKKEIWTANLRLWTGNYFSSQYMFDRTGEALEAVLECFQKNNFIDSKKIEILSMPDKRSKINEVAFILGIPLQAGSFMLNF